MAVPCVAEGLELCAFVSEDRQSLALKCETMLRLCASIVGLCQGDVRSFSDEEPYEDDMLSQ